VSCNPLEVKDQRIPPVFSGYASDGREGWGEFWSEYDLVLGPMAAAFSEALMARGTEPLAGRDFIWESPFLNLFVYPDEVDYPRTAPLAPTWHRLEASVRAP